MPLWLQHVLGIMKGDTKCCVVIVGQCMLCYSVPPTIGGLLVYYVQAANLSERAPLYSISLSIKGSLIFPLRNIPYYFNIQLEDI